MLLLLSFLAHSIIRFLSKQRITKSREATDNNNTTSQDNNNNDNSDAENEVFLFNESSFVNLFDSSKFNTIMSETNFNLLSQSEKSLKFLGTDEDFFSELTEENLKLLEMTNFDLNSLTEELLDSCSIASTPRFNSLFNSLTSMDLENCEIKDTDSLYGLDNENFTFEDEKLINESIIASCTLTSENMNESISSYSNLSEFSSQESQKSSTPIVIKRKRKSMPLKESVINSPSKHKKFLPKCERNRIAHKFYKRTRANPKSVQMVRISDTMLKQMSQDLKLASYKPSDKVEKLLNDSRGMLKYMVDYEGSDEINPKNFVNLTYASLMNLTNSNPTILESTKMFSNSLKSISSTPSISNKFSSNRSSSGYLTDC